MIPYSVLQSDHQPGAFVITVVSARAAQIYARLLAERFPGNKFAIQEGGAWGAPDCHPSIRDSARSFEVERLAATMLKRDAETNPEGLAKWHVYFLRRPDTAATTRCRAYADHDTPMRSRTFSSPDYIGTAIFYGDLPTPHDIGVMLEDFKASKEATA
ncbi:MAG: hypothetical protein DI616_14575 [Paracoccus denitrificans]|uniref:Uncharacterized protein n=2 Tax=Paracoccus TaxID=265 RepID=A0A1G7G6B7_9RHOB|nr:hypothetical protein [Paracoccus isoporae]TKW65397.1 MAG: hypothetical protein DI616_14575 [Paracoccus denitrificans]SDE83625.1 hypothetical protein SAMN05421538_11269 [Paracoccus isoporae]